MIQEWTPELIRQALVEEIGSGARPVELLDWWARGKGITIGVLFHVLVSSPEFVYREWAEGQGDWVWTLR